MVQAKCWKRLQLTKVFEEEAIKNEKGRDTVWLCLNKLYQQPAGVICAYCVCASMCSFVVCHTTLEGFDVGMQMYVTWTKHTRYIGNESLVFHLLVRDFTVLYHNVPGETAPPVSTEKFV